MELPLVYLIPKYPDRTYRPNALPMHANYFHEPQSKPSYHSVFPAQFLASNKAKIVPRYLSNIQLKANHFHLTRQHPLVFYKQDRFRDIAHHPWSKWEALYHNCDARHEPAHDHIFALFQPYLNPAKHHNASHSNARNSLFQAQQFPSLQAQYPAYESLFSKEK